MEAELDNWRNAQQLAELTLDRSNYKEPITLSEPTQLYKGVAALFPGISHGSSWFLSLAGRRQTSRSFSRASAGAR